MSTSPVQDQQNMSTSQQQHQKLLDALISNHKSFYASKTANVIFTLGTMFEETQSNPSLVAPIHLHNKCRRKSETASGYGETLVWPLDFLGC